MLQTIAKISVICFLSYLILTIAFWILKKAIFWGCVAAIVYLIYKKFIANDPPAKTEQF